MKCSLWGCVTQEQRRALKLTIYKRDEISIVDSYKDGKQADDPVKTDIGGAIYACQLRIT